MSVKYPLNEPFDALTGDLLPHYRDAYLHGQLSPTVALEVEQYLGNSSVRTRMALSRFHELTAAAQVQGRSITAPQWVQQQLGFQPTVSKVGPLRRPVVQTAIGLFGVLCIASGVQWVRNEPLVPAPVVAAVVQVAASASQATRQLVQRFSEAPAAPVRPERTPDVPTAPVRLATTKTSRPAPTSLVIETLATRPVSLALEPTDSLAKPAASTSAGPAASPAPAPAGTASSRSTTVRGYISDAQGRPLVGATVLVKGSSYQGTSTDATGHYELTAPVGAMLQYGYGGYTDHLQNASVGTVNVTLQPSASSGKSRFGRQQR